jgi:hypothetical protein
MRTVRPSWRNLEGRDWAPVYEEAQTIIREYGDRRSVRLVHHMPGGSLVSVFKRLPDGGRGAWVERYWLPESEADWPQTKRALLAVVE